MLLPSRQVLNVEKPFGEKSTNNTSSPVLGFKVKGRSVPALLRASKRAERDEAAALLKQEQAFMLLFASEHLHPPVYASSIVPAPFGCHGDRLLSLMARGVVMKDLLDAAPKSRLGAYTWNPKWQRAALRSLRSCLIRAAELGFCLLDIKPENIIYDVSDATAYVIDLDPNSVVWMDEDLLMIYAGRRDGDAELRRRYDDDDDDWFSSYARRNDERASYPPVVCARTRGTQLYIMYLLFHCHMHNKLGASQINGSFSILVLAFLKYALRSSCVPLQWINDYAQHTKGHFRGNLFQQLHENVRHYFFSQEEANQDPFTWFFLTYPIGENLLSKLCTGKEAFVTVEGLSFRDNRTSGAGGRAVVVERVEDRPYPCPLSHQSGRRYGIRWNTPYARSAGQVRSIQPASKIRGL